ncbi:LOW QUALITY PROTEIN: LLGL scribble cell polarity complex component 2-like [Pecten maximus]|uniref:LOW QUALITY PROTEIN: LLGL scribble cell polarity complex component 2-like n=1 Tax=Pecten maximus TaxID=6579 RepID=UPI0014583427|nr:LOW QUALITY PROTEIN: LLGL scribble cell polarity complex component 2-like [Pecten maximus]
MDKLLDSSPKVKGGGGVNKKAMDGDLRGKLQSVFDVCDVQKEGYITVDHFKNLAKEHFGADSDENVVGIVQILDPEGKGKINFDDFCQGVNQILELQPQTPVTDLSKSPFDFSSSFASNGLGELLGDISPTECKEVSEASAYTFNEYDTNTDEDGVGLLIDFSTPEPVRKDLQQLSYNSQLDCTDEENFEDFGEADDLESDTSDHLSHNKSCENCHKIRSKRGVNYREKHHRRSSSGHFTFSTPREYRSFSHQSASRRSVAAALHNNNHFPPKSRSPAPDDEVLADIDGSFNQLNDKVQLLENQILQLNEEKKEVVFSHSKLKDDNSILIERVHSLEEQLKDVEIKSDERVFDEQRKYKEIMSRQEREKSDEMEYVTRRLQTLESECDQLKQENPKLRLDIERLRNEKTELQEKLSETQIDYNTLLGEHEDFKRRSERERETTGQLLDELGKELGELRQYKIDMDLHRPRGESQGELPGRYHALQTEVTRLKEENKALHDTNEDLSAQLLTNCLEEGRSLVQNKENSLAAELDHLTKEELMDKLRKQTDINIRLEAYVDRILLRIMEMNPTLLEVCTNGHIVINICLDHGFPSKPSCMAHDSKLRLLAVGTKQGIIKVYGQPGVELTGELMSDATVNQLFFLNEEGRLVAVSSDNTIYLWEINVKKEKTVLENVKEFVFGVEEGKPKNISVCCVTKDGKCLLIGTEEGNIYMLDLQTFKLMEQIVYQDVVMQNVPDDFKVNPGAVETIANHPTNPDKFLIGYNRGLIVLWDNKECNADQTYNATQQLESVAWHRNGSEFISAHIDGSYIKWKSTDSSEPKEPALTPYGPFPCKAISKVCWKTAKSDPFIIFSGGMPRASYGDRHTISVMQENSNNHIVFDFTSKVVDFVTITRADENDTSEDRDENDEPHTLVVLAEEEIVLIDLDSNNWPTFHLPYMNSLHCSAITCSQHVGNIPNQLWQKIVDAGEAQMDGLSKRDWPINGGKLEGAEGSTKDLMLTGHEDGTVKFWDASGTSMKLLYKLSTCSIFNVDIHTGGDSNGEVEEEWPPFRKVGNYDPFSDDPRLGIQKISLCPLSETLVIAGTAGQVITLQMEREDREQEVETVKVNIVNDRDNFVWKGHEALPQREGDIKFASGFQPTSIMQVYPPAACTALAFNSEWQLVAAGTAHGFGLFDYAQKKEVLVRCTLNPTDMTGTSDTPMSRRKSLKKSLRESFRKLRRGRSQRREKVKKDDKTEEKTTGIEETPAEGATSRTSPAASPEPRPVERAVEARSTEDSMASMVRCLYFADTFITQGSGNTPSLWVGTNGGHVYIYSISVPTEKRSETDVTSLLAKEIKLRHKAPVISIGVVDSRARTLPDPLEVQHERAKAPEMSGQHSVVICSEEQLKIFSLPQLKARWKFKLTALHGSRIRKVAFVTFRSKSDENYTENDIACLSNQGDLSVYSIMTLREQLMASALRREDINGISSFTFTKQGQGFFLNSPSEYIRVTLSSRYVADSNCAVELKEGMRPEPEPEPVVEAAPVAEGTTEGAEEGQTAQEEEKQGEGENLASQQQYNSGDIAEALSDSQLMNDSRADTTIEGEITQDSIQVMETLSTEVTTEVQSSTVVETTTTTVAEVSHTASSVMETVTSVTSSTTEETTTQVNNIDDDTKATQPVVEEIDTSDKLKELKITEDVDETVIAKKVAQEADTIVDTAVAS